MWRSLKHYNQLGVTGAHRNPAQVSIRQTSCSTSAPAQQLTICRPDDWHLHLRDGAGLKAVVPHSAKHFSRAVVMPNLVPPVTKASQALEYKQRIQDAVPHASSFETLMTCYLTDATSPDDVYEAKNSGIVAYKLYPAGATTNSSSGVTNFQAVIPTLKAMADAGLLLLVHGEVTDPSVDFFDREKVFIEQKLKPILEKVPDLKVVMEHITTRDAADFVQQGPETLAASITPQHMLLNRNALFLGGLRPHAFCLPILKREEHRQAVLAAATSACPRFFLGTDSAPHPKHLKEAACGCAGIYSAPVALALYAQAFEGAGALDRLEAFASLRGADFYGLPRNTSTITLHKEDWTVPAEFEFGDGVVVPMWAGQTLSWQVAAA
ncbi:hypothetical protein ABBQ32_010297 [Trebouxia sp. C0010 RCD-2024]